MKRTLDIAILGCGVAGLASALFLQRQGHRVVLFERFQAPAPLGSGLVIQPVGQRVLKALGLLGACLALGKRIDRLRGWEVTRERPVLDAAYGYGDGERFGLAIHRAALFEVLYGAVTGIPLHCGFEGEAVTSGPKRRLIARDGRREGPFDLVIDAAGSRSPLSPLRSRLLPFGALWGTLDWRGPGTTAPGILEHRYLRAAKMAGILPVGGRSGTPGEQITVFWSLQVKDHPDWLASPLGAWVEEAGRLWPRFAEEVARFEDHGELTFARYRQGLALRPAGRGLLHIGDSAHQTSPQLGQGANMALLDAWALAGALGQAQDIGEALALYCRARRRHLLLYQLLSHLFTPLYQSDSRLPALLRDRVLSPVTRLGLMKSLESRILCGELCRPVRGLDLPELCGPSPHPLVEDPHAS
jgi:2-polyprenyl-6-methoxyphenol hydroxylase-like FAD-dependent oxidoreductase